MYEYLALQSKFSPLNFTAARHMGQLRCLGFFFLQMTSFLNAKYWPKIAGMWIHVQHWSYILVLTKIGVISKTMTSQSHVSLKP